MVRGDLDSVVLSGWSSVDTGLDAPSILVVLPCCENGLMLHCAARSLFAKCVSAPVFIPSSYHHHWNPFRTCVKFVSRQGQNFITELQLSGRHKSMRARVVRCHHHVTETKNNVTLIVMPMQLMDRCLAAPFTQWCDKQQFSEE